MLQELHQRYLLQATWTARIRKDIYSLVNIERAERVLEVGSGTGVITHELNKITPNRVYGIDIDPIVTLFANKIDTDTRYTAGDGLRLPFTDNCFEIVLCHYLILWVTDPYSLLQEMTRVSKPGGVILALAEPDYGGRIDYPETLEKLGELQAEALES